DETRSCDLDLGDLRALAKLGCNPLGEIAWLYARVLGKRHGGVGGKVAMGGIPRRFYHDSLEVRRARKRPCGSESFDGRADVRGEEGEHVHATRLTQFRSRVKKPGMLGKRIAVGHPGDEVSNLARPHRCFGWPIPQRQITGSAYIAPK